MVVKSFIYLRLLTLFIVPVLTIIGCGNREERKEYFKNYFTEAGRDDNNSQRLFSIWVAGDRQAYTKNIHIGGDEAESNKYFSAVMDILSGFRQANAQFPFILELVTDAVTYASGKKYLEQLKTIFPDNFRITLLTTISSSRLPPRKSCHCL
jgi:hypothetical protein